MAFDTSNLALLAHGNDEKLFYYDSGSDTLATVNTAGYFNNTDDDIRMTAGDRIIVDASDGDAMLRVASVSSGSVTTVVAGEVSEVETLDSGDTATTLSNTGTTELTGNTTGTFVMSAPFKGAEKKIIRTSSDTSATLTVNHGDTTITFDGTNDDLTFDGAGEAITLVGKSATRWLIMSNQGSVGAS